MELEQTCWDMSFYNYGGELQSSILDTQTFPEWGAIEWNCIEPTGTDVSFQVRASNSSYNMGAWSSEMTEPGSLSGIIDDSLQYFQYRAVFSTEDSLNTPELLDVTISWEPLGIDMVQEPLHIEGIHPNPSAGLPAIEFYLMSEADVEYSIYDISGRMLVRKSGHFPQGYHEIQIDDLVFSGMYILRLSSGYHEVRELLTILR